MTNLYQTVKDFHVTAKKPSTNASPATSIIKARGEETVINKNKKKIYLTD